MGEIEKNILDEKLALILGFSKEGYVMEDRKYNIYQSNDDFNMFCLEMKEKYPNAYNQYSIADGGELNTRNSRPPKMASAGSSSRLAYLLFRDSKGKIIEINKKEYKIDEVIFEGKLRTFNSHQPNMDVILKCKSLNKKEDVLIFIEVKCHEIYTTASNVISPVYFDKFDKLMDIFKNNAEYKTSIKGEKYIKLKNYKGFDMKQTICHILGISNFINKKDKLYYIEYQKEFIKYENQKIIFCHLIFNPTNIDIDEKCKKIYRETIHVINRSKEINMMINEFADNKIEYACISQSIIKENIYDK